MIEPDEVPARRACRDADRQLDRFDFAGARVAVKPDFDRGAMRDLLALSAELGERGAEVALRRVP